MPMNIRGVLITPLTQHYRQQDCLITTYMLKSIVIFMTGFEKTRLRSVSGIGVASKNLSKMAGNSAS